MNIQPNQRQFIRSPSPSKQQQQQQHHLVSFSNHNQNIPSSSSSSSSSSQQNSILSSSSWPLIPDCEEPAPPFYPLTKNPGQQQALFTTFPSRSRLGTSSLSQPIYTNGYIQNRLERANSPFDQSTLTQPGSISLGNLTSNNALSTKHPSLNSFSSSLDLGSGRRTRKVINYSENETKNLDLELESIGDEDSNSRTTRPTGRGRPSSTSLSKLSNGVNSPRNNSLNQSSNTNPGPGGGGEQEQRTREEIELQSRKYADGKSYLGEEPPAKWVKVQRRKRRPSTVMNTLLESQNFDYSGSDSTVSLVPIRIEFETEEMRIKDVFTWNIGEKFITPEAFSIEFCNDLGISPNVYGPRITEQIKIQLKDLGWISAINVLPDDFSNDHSNDVDCEEKVERNEEGGTVGDDDERLVPKKRSEDKSVEMTEPDLRVIIHIDVQIQTLHLIDRIEWDLGSQLTPELFTTQYIKDLNLPRSALPIISHAIHEEILRHKRECIGLGLISMDAIQSSNQILNSNSNNTNNGVYNNFRVESLLNDPMLKEKYGNNYRGGSKKLEGVWRDWNEANLFGPKFEELHPEDVEWIELEKERMLKRSRRDNFRNSRRR